MRNEIRRKAEEDMPVLAECGGYLYLLKELEDENGTGYEMAGVFSGKGFKKGKNSHFGYITVETESDSLYLKAGERIKGHEFHYWESTQDENELKMQAQKAYRKARMALCDHKKSGNGRFSTSVLSFHGRLWRTVYPGL